MFSKKSLHISFAFVLLIALATLGLAYGAWQETLNINGNVTTGSFDVVFEGAYGDDYETVDVGTCAAEVSSDGKSLTVTVTNGYPGYNCQGAALVKNNSSIPVTVNGLVAVEAETSPYFTIDLRDPMSVVVPPGGSFDLPAAPSTQAGIVWFEFFMPASTTDGAGESSTFTYTILAEQAQ